MIAGPLEGSDELDVLSATYSTDGRYIIGVSTNGIIRKWDVLTSCLVWEKVTVRGQINSGWMASAVFSPDTKSVVFGDKQEIIRVWNVDTGEQNGGPLEGHTGSVSCLSFSSDSKYLASGSSYGTVVIQDMDERRVKTGPIREHTGMVMAVSFSSCGTKLVSGSEDETILVWNVSTGEVLREIICEGQVYSVTYSPNGLFILAGGAGLLSMWNVTDDTAAPKEFQVDSRRIVQALFSPDGGRFASRDDNVIQIWDASWSTEETKTAPEEQGEITSISLSPGG